MDFEPGSRFADPTCDDPTCDDPTCDDPTCDGADGAEPVLCPVHDTVEKRWRHLDFFQHDTTLVARVPRVRTEEGRTVLAEVPWARPGSGFTLLMEAIVLAFCRDMPVSRVADLLGEHDTRLWRVVLHHVEAALEQSSWAGALECVAIDETSTAKGHVYATGVVALEKEGGGKAGTSTGGDAPRRARLLFLTPGRKAEQVGEFAAECRRRGHDPAEEVQEAAIDMSAAYIKGVAEHLPGASVCFDRFHVMAMAGKAVDEVRRAVAKDCGGLPRGSLWALRGDEGRLSGKQRDLRSQLCRAHDRIARAMAMKEYLATLWEAPHSHAARIHLAEFASWAQRSRLAPFVKLARSVRRHAEGILGYYRNRSTSAAMEAINGKLQLARKWARGYRNFRYFRAVSFMQAGRLALPKSPCTH